MDEEQKVFPTDSGHVDSTRSFANAPTDAEAMAGRHDDKGGHVPPPPEPEVKMRTMESDIKSVEESGGDVPEAQIIRPEGPVFKPETAMPSIDNKSTALPEMPDADLKEKSSVWIWVVVGIVVIVALGLLGYLYVWPLVSPTSPTPADMPLVGTEQPTPTLTPVIVHQSAFGFSDTEVVKVNVSDLSMLPVLTALQNEAEVFPAGNLKEFRLIVNESSVVFGDYLATLLPELSGSNLETTLTTIFEDDFTAYFYYEEGKAWPGYVVKIKEGVEANPVTVMAQLADLENTSISNLYLTPPVGEIGEFRTGSVGDKYTSRYAPYNDKPASFNYGLFGDYLIMATSYKGLMEAVTLLGL